MALGRLDRTKDKDRVVELKCREACCKGYRTAEALEQSSPVFLSRLGLAHKLMTGQIAAGRHGRMRARLNLTEEILTEIEEAQRLYGRVKQACS